MSLRGERRVVAADDHEREQGYDNDRATPDEVIVAVALAVSVTWVGIVAALLAVVA